MRTGAIVFSYVKAFFHVLRLAGSKLLFKQSMKCLSEGGGVRPSSEKRQAHSKSFAHSSALFSSRSVLDCGCPSLSFCRFRSPPKRRRTLIAPPVAPALARVGALG